MRTALPALVLLLAGSAAVAGGSRLPLVSTNGVSLSPTCSSADHVHRRTADGAFLDVTLSRNGCNLAAASIELLGARSGAWLWIGTTDIYQVGRLALECSRSGVTSSLRLDPGTATAYVAIESTASRHQRTLQPGQRLRLPSIAAAAQYESSRRTVEWSVEPGGEAGWTDAQVVEVARPGCRTDVHVPLTAFRNG